MEYKNYNKLVLSALCLLIFFVVAFNYIIDPLNVFGTKNRFNEQKPNVDKNQRISKIPALKLDKNKIDAIWVGSSKTGWSSNENYESSILNANIKNLTLNSCSFYEAISMAKNSIFVHPEIKTVYFGIDFAMMLKPVGEDSSLEEVKNRNITHKEILPLILSLDTFQHAFKTFSSNLKSTQTEQPEYGLEKQYNKKVLHKFKNTSQAYYKNTYKDFKFDNKKIEDLKEFVSWGEKNNVKIIFFTTTMHIAERIIIFNTGNIDEFYNFKTELAEIQPYYDFAIIDKYTTDEIKPDMQYFRDAVHAYSFIRKKISRKLFGYEEDFGNLVTKENVKQKNSVDKERFDKYLQENPKLVEQVKKWCKQN